MSNRFAISALAALVLVGSLISCSKKETGVEYYRKARLNGQYDIVGRYPLETDYAKKALSYRFTHDDKGRLIRVEYFHKGKPAMDRSFGSSKVEIEYQPEIEIRRYLNADGKPMFNYLGVYIERFALDSDGRRISRSNFSKEDQPMPDRNNVFTYLWTIDDQGRRIKSVSLDGAGKPMIDPSGISEIRVKYDDRGRMSEQSYHGTDGRLISDKTGIAGIRFVYNERDEVIRQEYFAADSAGNENPRYTLIGEWDENGYSTLNKRINPDGQVFFTYKIVYDEFGDALNQEYYDAGDTLVSITSWEYNEHGQITRLTVKDKEGNIIREQSADEESR